MLELQIFNLTAAITRLADLMEANTATPLTPNPDQDDVAQHNAIQETLLAGRKLLAESAPAPAPVDLVAMRQQAQDTCLETVRSNRDNKATIGNWLAEHDAKTIKQLGDEHLPAFIAFLEWLIK